MAARHALLEKWEPFNNGQSILYRLEWANIESCRSFFSFFFLFIINPINANKRTHERRDQSVIRLQLTASDSASHCNESDAWLSSCKLESCKLCQPDSTVSLSTFVGVFACARLHSGNVGNRQPSFELTSASQSLSQTQQCHWPTAQSANGPYKDGLSQKFKPQSIELSAQLFGKQTELSAAGAKNKSASHRLTRVPRTPQLPKLTPALVTRIRFMYSVHTL